MYRTLFVICDRFTIIFYTTVFMSTTLSFIAEDLSDRYSLYNYVMHSCQLLYQLLDHFITVKVFFIYHACMHVN